jgi:hypothetical protein
MAVRCSFRMNKTNQGGAGSTSADIAPEAQGIRPAPEWSSLSAGKLPLWPFILPYRLAWTLDLPFHIRLAFHGAICFQNVLHICSGGNVCWAPT